MEDIQYVFSPPISKLGNYWKKIYKNNGRYPIRFLASDFEFIKLLEILESGGKWKIYKNNGIHPIRFLVFGFRVSVIKIPSMGYMEI